MSEIGWIKLHRKIRENPFWEEQPFDKARAWIDLILSANHDPNKFLLGNEMVSVDRGSFITSEKKLMAKWGWSKSKVRAFLSLLEKQSMIVKKTDSKKTILEIQNYSIYQDNQRSDYVQITSDLRSDYVQKKTTLEAHDSYITGDYETAKEPQKNRKKTAKEPQKDTNNNDKNDKEGKEGKEDISIDHFEEFWKLYPKKIAKTSALKCWNTLIKNKTSPDDLIAASSNYAKASSGKEEKFILQASTFLGPQKRYEDFIKGVGNSGTTKNNLGAIASGEAEADEEWPITNYFTR